MFNRIDNNYCIDAVRDLELHLYPSTIKVTEYTNNQNPLKPA